jgi:PAS domain S-box-containing protein
VDDNLKLEGRAHRNQQRRLSVHILDFSRSRAGIGSQAHRQLLEELPSLVLALDAQGDIVFGNRRSEAVTGCVSAEVLGNPSAREMLWREPIYSEHLTRQSFASDDFRCEIACKDGQTRYIHWHIMSDRFGIDGWATWAIGNDVTDSIILEQAQQQDAHAKAVSDTLPAIRTPENELEHLFFILAQNAVQAADGSENRCLLITGSSHDGRIELQFRDNCSGIEPANLPKLFKPFFTTKPPGKGTGLGLCIAQRIVQQRGGQISVQNRYGQGAIFTVTLPVN